MGFRLLVVKAAQRVRKTGLRATLCQAYGSLKELFGRRGAMDAFDQQYGTDTGGAVPLWKLKLDSPNAAFGIKYQPSDEQEIRAAIAFLHENPRDITFIDLGCGKGRVLLVAATQGFRQMIGVEFAHELAEVARRNLAKMHVTNAAVVHGDAADYEFPDRDPTIVYLYNPFLEEVIAKVIVNLKKSRARKLFVIYKVPSCAALFDQSGFLTRIGSPPGIPYVQIWKRSDSSGES